MNPVVVNTKPTLFDKITYIFVFIDDIINLIEPLYNEQLLPYEYKGNKKGRKPQLYTSEIVTLAIFRYFVHQTNWKSYHNYVYSHLLEYFPGLPNYPNF